MGNISGQMPADSSGCPLGCFLPEPYKGRKQSSLLFSINREEHTMKIMNKTKLAVVAVLVIGAMAIESEVQARGIDGIFLPLPPLPSVVFSYNDRDRHHDDYRPRHRPSQVCWEEAVHVERRHGGYREVTRTVCRDRGWRGHHHDHWRDGHRDRYRW